LVRSAGTETTIDVGSAGGDVEDVYPYVVGHVTRGSDALIRAEGFVVEVVVDVDVEVVVAAWCFVSTDACPGFFAALSPCAT
jgi:hypothetical protein